MEPVTLVSVISIALSLIGASLGAVSKLLAMKRTLDVSYPSRAKRRARGKGGAKVSKPMSTSRKVLVYFAVVVGIFAILTLRRYWLALRENEDIIYFAVWLFIAMVAGMFVQVLSSNYRSGKPLFEVKPDQLIFPLLYALVVFYPIWAIGASAPKSLFSFYAAFLNGYFWETVVSSAKLPTPPAKEASSQHRPVETPEA